MSSNKRRRKNAEAHASEILRNGRRPVTDVDVLEVLKRWRFNKSTARQNVLPEGEEYVFSDHEFKNREST